MATSDQADDFLSAVVGGVVCRAGGRAVGEAEGILRSVDSRELVEDKLKIGSDDPKIRKKTFQESPWKNYFLVVSYLKSDINKPVLRGTAFLTDLVRVENGMTYAIFLTAGHVLFGYDRIELKHSSELVKRPGDQTLGNVEPFIDLRTPHNKKKGWFEVCSKFTDSSKDAAGPNDYGAIFVKEKLLQMLMEHIDMRLEALLTSVAARPLDVTSSKIFVAGYPLVFGVNKQCTYLVSGEGNYRPLDSLPKRFIKKKATGRLCRLPGVDVHTADTSEGMSGSPVVLSDFPPLPTAKVIAIHVGGIAVDEKEFEWADAPDDFKNGLGVNFAIPITDSLLKDLQFNQL